MAAWWNGLSLITQIYYCIAIAATVILLLQSILLFFGIGDHDCDTDDGGGACEGDDGLNLFTIRGIVAFFTMGGWTGVVLSSIELPDWLTIVISIVAGAVALFVVALIMRAFSKMQTNGVVDLNNAIGKSATVYIPVRANSVQGGKVTLSFQGRFMELEAVTDDDTDYVSGETVEVVGLRGDAVVITHSGHPVETQE